MMTTSDPTAPDAVAMLQRMHARAVYCANHGDVPRVSSAEVLVVLRAIQAERARHAEEVARLRDVHLDETRALDDLRLKEIASLRDQLRKVEGERAMWEKTASVLSGKLDSLRSLLPDVRACAEYVVANSAPAAALSKEHQVFRETARRIIAALDSRAGRGSDESVR